MVYYVIKGIDPRPGNKSRDVQNKLPFPITFRLQKTHAINLKTNKRISVLKKL